MDFSLRVEREHFEYLRIQKGSLDDIAHDRPRWHREYERDLRETYDQVAPWLPKSCDALLDVGSGLGGIDVLLFRHYAERNQASLVRLLDGADDPPVMNLHRCTFNSMRVARDFQRVNGLPRNFFGSYSPDEAGGEPPVFSEKFDLIVSFGSWCFHYPPNYYLEAVRLALKPSTVLVLDVRRHRLEWMGDLERVLELVTMVAVKPKWSRCIFKVRQ